MAQTRLSFNSPLPLEQPDSLRQVLSDAQKALERIKDEQSALLEKETKLLQSIARYQQALAPHHKLDDPSLLHIFTCLSEDHGPVVFPLRGLQPQLVISHVCSRWRKIALSARNIWSHVHIHKDVDKDANRRIYLRWLARVRSYPVSLAINLSELHVAKTFEAVSIIMQAVRVKALNLRVTASHLEAMNIPESMHSNFEDVKLTLTLSFQYTPNYDLRHPHHLLDRASSVIFQDPGPRTSLLAPGISVPWGQLLYLDIQDFTDMTLQEAVRILQQTPIVEELFLGFRREPGNNIEVEKLTLSCLRKLTLRLYSSLDRINTINDAFLKAFECPKLVKFNLFTQADWSPETYNLLKRQYSLENLEHLDMNSKSWGCCLPLSAILRDAPMLRKLGLTKGVILDDDAIIGITTGTLGCYLSSIWFRGTYHSGEVFDMVLSRQKNARRLISESQNWKEDITLLCQIYLEDNAYLDYNVRREYQQRDTTLIDAGVKVRFLSSVPKEIHPFRPIINHLSPGFDDL